MISLFLGGARSGKSDRALTIDAEYAAQYFVATAEVTDEEFAERIARHQAERSSNWQTIEAPVQLVEAIGQINHADSIIVVDCLTVWLGNLMHYQKDLDAEIERLLEYIASFKGELRLVSNEVGLGVVPETPMGRRFRDQQGRLNKQIASIADRVELLVAGIPMVVKS